MHTYTIIRGIVLEGRSLLPSKLVLKHKYNTKGEVIRKKVRLYIWGDKQTPDIDYFETFALVVRYNTFRFLIAKVAAKDLKLDYINVKTIFLNPLL
jgi:Reverse transcriptase (RNA-dependent DNA polymerase)